MEAISIRNFRSYEATSLAALHPRVNLFLGANGQGKSNLLRAISFVLSHRVAYNRNELSAYTHVLRPRQKGLTANQEPLDVEVVLADQSRLQRTWTFQAEELRVNGRAVSRSDFEQTVESLGFAYDNPYNLVQQGSITHIAAMDAFELFRLLEEANGLKRHRQRVSEAAALVEASLKDKANAKALLDDLSRKFAEVEGKKCDFEQLEAEERRKKARAHRKCARELEEVGRRLGELRLRISEESAQANNLALARQRLAAELDAVDTNIQVSLGQVRFLKNEAEVGAGVEVRSAGAVLGANRLQLEATLRANEQRRRDVEVQLGAVRDRVEALRSEVAGCEERRQGLHTLLDIQQRNHGNRQETAKERTLLCRQSLRDYEAEELRLQEKARGLVSAWDRDKQASLQQAEEAFVAAESKLKANKLRQIEASRRRNHKEMELEAVNVQRATWLARLGKVLPQVNLDLLATAQREGLKGVLGYLVDLVEIESEVLFAFEDLALQKLFTVIVEDDASCASLIALNRQLKGRTLHVLSLAQAKRSAFEHRGVPDSEDVVPLTRPGFVRLKGSLNAEAESTMKKVLQNMFGKLALARDYDTALRAAKEQHVTCVTPEHEIVHAEAVLCKVGSESFHEGRLSVYYNFVAKNELKAGLARELQAEAEHLLSLQKEEILLAKAFKSAEAAKLKLQEQQEQAKRVEELRKKCEEGLARIQAQKSELIREIEMLARPNQKGRVVVGPEDLDKAQKELEKKAGELRARLEEELTLEAEQEKLALVQAELASSASTLDLAGENPEDSEKLIGSLERELVELEQRKGALRSEEASLERREQEVESRKAEMAGEMAVREEQSLALKTKLASFGPLAEPAEADDEDSVSRAMEGKSLRMTSKNEVLYRRCLEMKRDFDVHKAYFGQLCDSEEVLRRHFAEFEAEQQRAAEALVEQFRGEFGRLFAKVVDGGRWDVRLRRTLEDKHSRLGLAIRVGFNSHELKKLGELSGGEKTVVAVCVMLALQRLEAARFYVLDEVDSALDAVYAQKVMDVIYEESQHAQFFLTTFKWEVVAKFAAVGHIYAVESHNRVSSVRALDPSEAESFCADILH